MICRLSYTSFSLCAVLIWISCGCTFDITGENFVEVSQEPKSELIFDVTEMPDTVLILTPKDYEYDFQVKEGWFYGVRAYIDGEEIYESSNRIGKINIDPFRYQHGVKSYHEFVVQVYTSTSTGSLADQVGAEALVYQLERTLEFDRRPPVEATFEIVESGDGIRVEFGEYPNKNLAYFSVYTSYDQSTLFETLNRRGFIYSSENAYYDSAYLGGTMYLGVVTSVFEFRGSTSPAYSQPQVISIAPSPRLVSAERVGNNSALIAWSPPPYTKGFQSYKVSWTGPGAHSIEIENVMTDHMTIEGLYVNAETRISVEAKNYTGYSVRSDTAVSITQDFVPFTSITGSIADPSLVLVNDFYGERLALYKDGMMTGQTDSKVQAITLDVTNNKVYGSLGRVINIFELPGLQLIKTIDLETLYTAFRSSVSKINVIDAQRIIFREWSTILFNTSTLETEQSNFFWRDFDYSPESNDLLVYGRNGTDRYLYLFTNGNFGSPAFLVAINASSFFAGKDHVFLKTDDETIEVRNRQDLSWVGSYSIDPQNKIIGFDKITATFLIATRSSLTVKSALNGADLLSMPFVDNREEIGYFNGTIYFGSGKSFKLAL